MQPNSPMQANLITMPVSPIEKLARVFSNNLFMPDPSALYLLMGSVAANMIEGSPVWLMLVGPPSCGKSELLNSLLAIPGMVEAADIASEAAFLSGSATRDRTARSTGGLLCQVGMHGGIILNDFTSVLSKPFDKVNTIMSVLRECYGGRWTRHIGGEGGREINWQGKLAMYAGVTGKIDQHHQVSAELGERWIYWRYEPREDCFGECWMATDNSRGPWRETIRNAAREFFVEIGLGYGVLKPRRDLTMAERLQVIDLAAVAARCRSGVARDQYNKEILGAREVELATRLSTVLSQLLIGLDFIGVPANVSWQLLLKVVMGSMPRLRQLTIQAVTEQNLSVVELTSIFRCSKSVVERLVQDLEMHEVVRRESGKVHLSDWMAENYLKLVNMA